MTAVLQRPPVEAPPSARTGPDLACPACEATGTRRRVRLRRGTEIHRCRACGAEFARRDALAAETGGDHFEGLDPERYDSSVGATRRAGFVDLLAQVERHVAQGRWLDVGCSFGWLLESVARRRFRGFGVDPSISSLPDARDRGAAVCAGRFPAAIGPRGRFDVVSFIDVLEHFARPDEVLAATRDRVDRHGLLVVQVPDRACYLYRLASALSRLPGERWRFALERLWLEGFDYPHQVYFTRRALDRLLRRTGFEPIEWHRPSIGRPGQAFDRVSYTGTGGAYRLAVGAAVAALAAADAAAGHGGLITVLARRRDGATPGGGT